MATGKVDFNLTAQQVADIKAGFATVEALLTWTVNMSDEQRSKFYKAGKKLAVINDARNALNDNPTAFPGSYDGTAYLRDVDGFNIATELTGIAERIRRKLDDTRMMTGVDCMEGVSVIRDHIDAAARTTPGLVAVSNQLAAYFKHDAPAKKPATP